MKRIAGLLSAYALMAFSGETSLREQTTPRIKENLRERRKKAKESRIVNIRLARGEKQWFLGDTEEYVWARTEQIAQKKWKKKLSQDLCRKESERKGA